MYQYVAVATLIGLGFSTGVHFGQRHGLRHHETVLHATDELISMLKTNITQLEEEKNTLFTKVQEIKDALASELSESDRLRKALHDETTARKHAEEYSLKASTAFIELKNRLTGIELPIELANDLNGFITEITTAAATLPVEKGMFGKASSAIAGAFKKGKKQ